MKRIPKPSFTAETLQQREKGQSRPMSPIVQRILIGLVVAVTAGGITAWSTIVLNNLSASTRIEATLDSLAVNFNNFTLIRYQDDMKMVEDKIAAANARIDKLRDSR
jgi:hypothetical protein